MGAVLPVSIGTSAPVLSRCMVSILGAGLIGAVLPVSMVFAGASSFFSASLQDEIPITATTKPVARIERSRFVVSFIMIEILEVEYKE
jgi:hypothetical protein